MVKLSIITLIRRINDNYILNIITRLNSRFASHEDMAYMYS